MEAVRNPAVWYLNDGAEYVGGTTVPGYWSAELSHDARNWLLCKNAATHPRDEPFAPEMFLAAEPNAKRVT